jgi:hypothetical protein
MNDSWLKAGRLTLLLQLSLHLLFDYAQDKRQLRWPRPKKKGLTSKIQRVKANGAIRTVWVHEFPKGK